MASAVRRAPLALAAAVISLGACSAVVGIEDAHVSLVDASSAEDGATAPDAEGAVCDAACSAVVLDGGVLGCACAGDAGLSDSGPAPDVAPELLCPGRPCAPSCDRSKCGASDGCGGICTTGCTCRPDTCAGCCRGDVCIGGDAGDACGSGGEQCGRCSGAETCGAHGCEPHPTTVLLFGGADDKRVFGDTWLWKPDAGDWESSDAGGPPARWGAAAATVGERVVMFGGFNATSGTTFDDTWIWDGTTWSSPKVEMRPPRRVNAVAAPLNGNVVLFGGLADQRLLGDTWLWDGSQWTERCVSGPPPRKSSVMANVGGRVILYGGEGADGGLGDVWEWDGTTWTSKEGALPPKRAGAAMAPFAGALVLFGGDGLDETWSSGDGSAWWKKGTGSGPGSGTLGSSLANAGAFLLLFGGKDHYGDLLGDPDAFEHASTTWTWDGQHWTEVWVDGPNPRANAVLVSY